MILDAPTPDSVIAFLDKADEIHFLGQNQFNVQVQPRPQGAFYVFIIEGTKAKVSVVLQYWPITIMPFLKGTHAAVEVLQHPFFAKVGA